MPSGARWNEDCSDKASDINRLGAAMAEETSLSDFVGKIESATTPGTFCQYNSVDTQALGMLVMAATGRTLADYMHEKICEPLGMESAGYWILDSEGAELALGGLNLTARDFAKIDELYRLKGVFGDKQVVPQAWVEASVVPNACHLMPGKVTVGGHIFPFGY
jgi:CubicO group peptidase (beta-lactamase class C family)